MTRLACLLRRNPARRRTDCPDRRRSGPVGRAGAPTAAGSRECLPGRAASARLGRFLLILALLSAAAAAESDPAAEVPPPFTATYSVDHGVLEVGKTHVEFRRPTPGRYHYRSHSYTVGVADLFYGDEVRERSDGVVDGSGLRPLVYRYRRTGSREREGELRFHWEDGEVVNDVGGHPWHMDIPRTAKDRVVGSVQLMTDLARGERSLVYHVADGGWLRTYRFKVKGEGEVDTGLGSFHALKVVRKEEDGNSRTVLWCAPSLHYLAVRIEHHDREEGDYTMELEKLEGLGQTGKVEGRRKSRN